MSGYDSFRMSDIITAPLAFVVGAIVGSFLNVVILRSKAVAGLTKTKTPLPPHLRGGERFSLSGGGELEGMAAPAGALRGRSHCPYCHKVLSWQELIPILSFVFQRGRCRHCQAKISVQYPFVELTMGMSALILFTPLPKTPPELLTALLTAAAVALLIILFVIDLRTFLLPDIFVGLLALVVIVHVALQVTSYKLPVTAPLWGALIGSGFLTLLWLVTFGRGIGIGDIKLMIPLGALFGPAATTLLLLISFVIGGTVAAGLLTTRKATLKTPVPFGPFLAGIAIVFLLAPNLPNAILTRLIIGV